MRLDKFILKSTTLTKAECLSVIQNKQILVNGEAVNDAAFQVHENNIILLAGERLYARPFRYLLLNKAPQTICSNQDGVYPSIFNLIDINNSETLHIAGRLDVDTTGLLLITDNGRWTFNITSPKNDCIKIYRVGLLKAFDTSTIDLFEKGMKLLGEDKLTKPAFIKVVNEKEVLLTLSEGKFHQVKRMFFTAKNKVVSLHREQIGQVKLDVEEGQWRYLTDDEINSFH